MPKPGITYKGKPIGASGKGGSKKKSSESTGSSKWLWIFAVVLVIAVIAFAVYRFTTQSYGAHSHDSGSFGNSTPAGG